MGGQVPKYDDDFKRTIVTLHQGGKSMAQLSKEYGIAMSTVSKWVKLYASYYNPSFHLRFVFGGCIP